MLWWNVSAGSRLEPAGQSCDHRSGGWKKDLDFYMGAYFRLNYRQEPASKWPALKAKFFEFLIDHHSEWKSIRITIRSGISVHGGTIRAGDGV